MIYCYEKQEKYSLKNTYETIKDAICDRELNLPLSAATNIGRVIKSNGEGEDNLRTCGGYVWTDQPLDMNAYEEDTSAREENIPALDPDELRETINHMSNLNGSMRMGA